VFFSRRPGGPGRDGRRVANAIVGSNFNDVFSGDGNDNTLNGGFGFDHLDGRGGNDRLVGGNGSDTFVFAAVPAASNTNPSGTNFDTVADYAAGTDKIDLTALGLGQPEQLGGLEVDLKLKLCWLFYWQVSWMRALEYPIDVNRRLPKRLVEVWAVAQ